MTLSSFDRILLSGVAVCCVGQRFFHEAINNFIWGEGGWIARNPWYVAVIVTSLSFLCGVVSGAIVERVFHAQGAQGRNVS